jgi:hypothetical protein
MGPTRYFVGFGDDKKSPIWTASRSEAKKFTIPEVWDINGKLPNNNLFHQLVNDDIPDARPDVVAAPAQPETK